MSLWEFDLVAFDGTITDQSVIAEGADESESAVSACDALPLQSGATISRPGRWVVPLVEAKWREICEGASFPLVVANAGRLALYARRFQN